MFRRRQENSCKPHRGSIRVKLNPAPPLNVNERLRLVSLPPPPPGSHLLGSAGRAQRGVGPLMRIGARSAESDNKPRGQNRTIIVFARPGPSRLCRRRKDLPAPALRPRVPGVKHAGCLTLALSGAIGSASLSWLLPFVVMTN